METKKIYKVSFFAVVILNLALIAWGWVENFDKVAIWKHGIAATATLGILWVSSKIYCSEPGSIKKALSIMLQIAGLAGIIATIGAAFTASPGNDLLPFIAVGEFLWSAFILFLIQDEKKPHLAKACVILLGLMCYAWLAALIPALAIIQPVLRIAAILSVMYLLFGLVFLALGREE